MERFPALLEIIPVALWEEPRRGKEEADEAFEARLKVWHARRDILLGVRLLPKPTVRDLSFKLQAVVTAERRRLRDLRQSADRELEPEVFAPSYRTPEGHRAMDELVGQVLTEGLVSVAGLRFGARDIAEERDVVKLFELLRHAGYHELAMMRVLGAQNVEPSAVFC